MAQLRVSTFEEFKSRYQFAMTEIRLKSVAAFDPNDATNQQRFTLDIAVLIRDSIDVAAALRDAKLARTALESTVQYKPVFEFGEVRTAYAPIVLFPASALPGVPFTADALTTLFAAEQILAIFVAPP
jgi:hypothetical protein